MKTEEIKLNTPLKIDEIDFRIQSINLGGYATILAYKDARVDMNRLDAVYGAEGWQAKYEVLNGHLFCSIGIWSEAKNQWIWKQNVGTESNTEKTKGEASDAFKRAGFCVGIGRELYDYPVIQVKLNADEFQIVEWQGKKKAQATYQLKLKEWVWASGFEGNKLVVLAAKDKTGELRFRYDIREKKETKSLKTA